jgi:trigger factor
VELEAKAEAIKRRILPEVDDEFAEIAGQVDTVGELRQALREQIEARRASERKKQGREALEQKLLETAEFDLPRGYVDSKVDDEYAMRERTLKQSGLDTSTLSMARGAIEEQVRDKVRLEFILAAIAEREGVEIADEEVESYIEGVVRRAGRSGPQIRQLYRDSGRRKALAEQLRLDKTLDFLLSRATFFSGGDSDDVPAADEEAPEDVSTEVEGDEAE